MLIDSDAILVCLGDTLMSVMAGFSVFAMMGVLATELNTSVDNVITSGKYYLTSFQNSNLVFSFIPCFISFLISTI